MTRNIFQWCRFRGSVQWGLCWPGTPAADPPPDVTHTRAYNLDFFLRGLPQRERERLVYHKQENDYQRMWWLKDCALDGKDYRSQETPYRKREGEEKCFIYMLLAPASYRIGGAGSDRAHHQREHEGSCVVVSAVVVEDGMQNALGEQTHIYASLQMVFA